MIISKINEIKKINLTGLPIANLYMYEIDSNEKINLPNNFKSYENAIKNIVSSVNIKEGKFYVTIDTKVVKSGRTHRRPGKHVDGNYIFAWGGGGGWLVGKDGKYLNEKQHEMQYCNNKKGATLIISSEIGCKAYKGVFKGKPLQGGNCEHINTDEGFLLKENTLYLMNSTCIHESIKINETKKRVLIRITLPESYEMI